MNNISVRKGFGVVCFALVGAGAMTATPAEMERAALREFSGTKKHAELLQQPQVQRSLSQATGRDYKRVMSVLSQPSGTIDLVDGHLQVAGFVPDRPEVEAAVVCLSLSDSSAHVLLVDGNSRTLYSKTKVYTHLPRCVRTAILIDYYGNALESPPAQGNSEYRLDFK